MTAITFAKRYRMSKILWLPRGPRKQPMTFSKSWTSCLQTCEYIPILFIANITDKVQDETQRRKGRIFKVTGNAGILFYELTKLNSINCNYAKLTYAANLEKRNP